MPFSSLLDTSLAYLQRSDAPDGAGGSTPSWKQMIAAMPCAVQPASSTTIEEFAKRQIRVDIQIFTTADLAKKIQPGIRAGDKVADCNGTSTYLIEGYTRQQNRLISQEPLYCLICKQLGDS